MVLRPLIKIFGRLFHRKCSLAKRSRNPSTFQECLDSPQQPRGYWKSVLFVVLLLPTIYYMFYFKRNSIEPFNESSVVNEQNTVTDPGEIITVHKKYDKKPTKDKDTIYNDDVQTYLSTNISEEKIAQDFDVKMGGHYTPKDCRPRHKVAILVPYWWNRKNNLKLFSYYIHPFLIRQRLDYRIFVIEQYGDEPVNKGRLYNAGFLEIQRNDDWQCVIFHDVDLLPADDRNRYSCPVLPRHMSTAIVGKDRILKYNNVFGGVTAMTMWHFKKSNGYSNMYWGRGESEDMFKRLQISGLGIMRYKKDVGKYIPLKHANMPDNPDRVKLLVTAEQRYKDDGLSTLRYNVASYASYPLFTHIVVNVNNVKKLPDYITEASITLSP